MYKKWERVLAWIGIVFVATFAVSLILVFTDFNNIVYQALALTSGFIMLLLWAMIMIMTKERRKAKPEETAPPEEGEDGEDGEDEEPPQADDPEPENAQGQSADETDADGVGTDGGDN